MKKIFVIIVLISSFALESSSQVWSDEMNGLDSICQEGGISAKIYELHNYEDNILYIGGGFKYVNNEMSYSFCSWNADTVSTYQEGVEIGGVDAIIKYNDTLYIGGSFTSASENPNTAYLAIWNGTNWQTTSIGQADFHVRDFCIYNDILYLVGEFEHLGVFECNKIVAYNGEEWLNVGSFGMYARALEVFNGELYAGGYWGVRRYLGGTDWETFDVVPNGQINELMVDSINSFLFVGGQITQVDGEDSWGSAMWDGFNWTPMGVYYGNTVFSQSSAMYRGEYYVGNGIKNHGDHYEMFVKKWNGETWDSIGGNFNSTISALEVFRDTLYIGGHFTYWGGNTPIQDKRNRGLVKLYMPDNGCEYLKPRINTHTDTFLLNGGEAIVNLYNNNPYADTWEWDFADSQTGDVKDPVHSYTAIGEYNVQVTVSQDGCIKTANKTIYIEQGSDIEDFETIKMQIFPNPSSNGFTVKTSLPSYKKAEMKIAGLNGHLKDIIPVTGETTLIETKGWKHGIYVCNLFLDGQLVKTEKLIFQE